MHMYSVYTWWLLREAFSKLFSRRIGLGLCTHSAVLLGALDYSITEGLAVYWGCASRDGYRKGHSTRTTLWFCCSSCNNSSSSLSCCWRRPLSSCCKHFAPFEPFRVYKSLFVQFFGHHVVSSL